MLPCRARVDQGAMVMKGCSAFPIKLTVYSIASADRAMCKQDNNWLSWNSSCRKTLLYLIFIVLVIYIPKIFIYIHVTVTRQKQHFISQYLGNKAISSPICNWEASISSRTTVTMGALLTIWQCSFLIFTNPSAHAGYDTRSIFF